jgi:hypothetical protein
MAPLTLSKPPVLQNVPPMSATKIEDFDFDAE